MDTSKITKAARAEFAAEQSKTKSEATWRNRWWDTTLLLAETKGQTEAAAANAAVKAELSCSLDYLSQRRRTGKIIKSALEVGLVDLADVRQWTPRLSMAWVVDLKRDADGLVEAMDDAAAKEQSLREFIAAHGGIPMSTGKERFQPPAPPPTREEQVRQAREALADPDVAKDVMRDPRTAINAGKAERRAAVEEHEARQRDRDLSKSTDEIAADTESAAKMHLVYVRRELEDLVSHARQDLNKAISNWNEVGASLDGEAKEDVLARVDRMLAVATALREAVASGTTLEAELTAFLAGEGGQ